MKTAQITLQFRDSGLTVFYSKAFQNNDVIGMKLIKSGEWIFPIYKTDHQEKLSGYIYEGSLLSFPQIAEVLQKFAPPSLSDLSQYKERFKGKVKYYNTKIEHFQIVGEYSDREVIVKK